MPTSTTTRVPTATPTFEDIPPTPVQAPDLSIHKSHTGTFIQGGSGTFHLLVSNVGGVATSEAITVTDDLPFPFTLSALPSGMGWDCSGSGGTTVNCTTANIVAPNASLPEILVPVNVGTTFLRRIENLATVTTPNDTNPSNNTSTDEVFLQPTTHAAPALGLAGIVAGSLAMLWMGLRGLRRRVD